MGGMHQIQVTTQRWQQSVERVTVHRWEWDPLEADRRKAGEFGEQLGVAAYDPEVDTHARWDPPGGPVTVYAVCWCEEKAIFFSGPTLLAGEGDVFRFGPLPLEYTLSSV